MQIGVPKEILANEARVAITPSVAAQLIKLGFSISVEKEAGKLANFDDREYQDAGAHIVEGDIVWQSDLILKVNSPSEDEISKMKIGCYLISFVWPAQNLPLLQQFADKGITVLAMDSVPRISRAQSMDALSSMANIAGYRAIVEASHEFGRFFTGQITAAGKIPPAKVLVIGAGVAGLAAIGTAGSLGAIVRAFDTRPEVKEQVQSMGAEFLELSIKEDTNRVDGYASEMSQTFIESEMALFAAQAKEVDIIVTTALIPGKPAPKLINRAMVESMKSGSIIVDLAAQTGGNCELTQIDSIIKTENGVKIIGYTDLPSRLPTQSSQLYATNILNLLKLLCKNKDGMLELNFDDDVTRSVTIVNKGQITWPPPPIQVSAQPIPVNKDVLTPKNQQTITPSFTKLKGIKYLLCSIIAILFGYFAYYAPNEFLTHFTVFALACIVGYYVVWNVAHALHTPLMSVTNAISGIIIIGAVLQIGESGFVIPLLSFIAILIASINIFGGFTVTHRMLKMFRKN